MKWSMKGFDGTRLIFMLGLIEIVLSLLLYLEPTAFPIAAVTWLFPPLVMLFMIGGITLLMLARYGVASYKQRSLAGIAILPLTVVAAFPGVAVYRVISLLLVLVIAIVPFPRPGGNRATDLTDLFLLFLGLRSLGHGLIRLIEPSAHPSVFGAEPLEGLLGLLHVAVGLLLLFPAQSVRLGFHPRVAERAGLTLAVVSVLWFGAAGDALWGVVNLVFAATLLVRPEAIAARRPAGSVDPRGLTGELERGLEGWTWTVVLGAMLMATLEGFWRNAASPAAGLTVSLLVLYNLLAYWVAPTVGDPRRRTLFHLFGLAATMAYLMAGRNPAAHGIAVISVFPSLLATRAYGVRTGWAVLGTSLGVLLLVGAGHVVAGSDLVEVLFLLLRALAVGLGGGMVISVASEQRSLTRQLQQAHEELQAAHEELLSQNEELVETGTALHRLAQIDPLTGLVNRRHFQECLEKQLAAGGSGSLLFLDLDQFKAINDHMGHAAGDQLLLKVARALSAQAGSGDVVSRLGGDEFAVLAPGSDIAAARSLAERVLRQFGQLRGLQGDEFCPVQASIGITLYPEQGRTVEALLFQADMAMYDVKRSGRNGFRIYDASENVSWEREVRTAMEENRLLLHYQPILELSTQKVFRYEALLRMRNRQGDLISPAAFLPHVEALPLMHQVDRWVIRTALQSFRHFGRLHRSAELEINLSGRAFEDPDLLESIQAWFKETDTPPGRIIFEITETSAISDLSLARHFIETLRRVGCRFAIDDLGSGFASFSYLKHLPVDYIKIDGSLIEDLAAGRDLALVQGIVTIARGLGMKTIAEWVENVETLDLLRCCGVDYAQGFAIGHPAEIAMNKTGTPR